MAGSLEKFLGRPSAEVHPRYTGSVLAPVAPEYTTGEGLVAAAYRTLLLDLHDKDVDLAKIPKLPEQLVNTLADNGLIAAAERAPLLEFWRDLIMGPAGLSSPTPAGSQARLPQLMPLVPSVAHRSGVIGVHGRGRWQPATLLLSAIWSGSRGADGSRLVEDLRGALEVGGGDDLFARYVEACLAELEDPITSPTIEALAETGSRSAAWRSDQRDGHIPAERFVEDLHHVLQLKSRLTRRQWTALLEAQLRLGLATHQMWLCRLNVRVWDLTRQALAGNRPDPDAVVAYCWRAQESDAPFLELGADSVPAMRRLLANYARARLGINLLLFALDDAGAAWESNLGTGAQTPAHALSDLLSHVADNADEINARTRSVSDQDGDLLATAGAVADRAAKLVNARFGVTRNILFFLRYILGQLQPVDPEQSPYDQGFLIHRPLKRSGTERPVRPGPTALMLLVHAASRSVAPVPASMDLLRRHLAGYGIAASADELRTGSTVRELERLELVVDSPDAGGGRMLVDPLGIVERTHD